MQNNNSNPYVSTECEWLAVRDDYQDWYQFFSLISIQFNTICRLVTVTSSLEDSPEARQSAQQWQASLTRYRAHLTDTTHTLQRALNELEADEHSERVNWLVYIHPIVKCHMTRFANGMDALLSELENPE
ncbi:hypothetical protein [Spirosoma arcticum]